MIGHICLKRQVVACHGMCQAKTARVQMQLARDLAAQVGAPAIAKVLLTASAVFAITNDRMTNLGHMRAQLMGSSGDRNQSTPRRTAAQRRNHCVVRRRAFGLWVITRLARVDTQHLLTFAMAAVTRGLK